MFSKHKSQIINCCKTVSRILPTTSSYRTNLIMTSADKYSVAICQMTSTSDRSIPKKKPNNFAFYEKKVKRKNIAFYSVEYLKMR